METKDLSKLNLIESIIWNFKGKHLSPKCYTKIEIDIDGKGKKTIIQNHFFDRDGVCMKCGLILIGIEYLQNNMNEDLISEATNDDNDKCPKPDRGETDTSDEVRDLAEF